MVARSPPPLAEKANMNNVCVGQDCFFLGAPASVFVVSLSFQVCLSDACHFCCFLAHFSFFFVEATALSAVDSIFSVSVSYRSYAVCSLAFLIQQRFDERGPFLKPFVIMKYFSWVWGVAFRS